MPLKRIGYWFETPGVDSKYPLPQVLQTEYSTEQRNRLSQYLREGSRINQYRGYSWCRFGCGECDEKMGSAELTDGTWVWPEGLAHYVSEHSVSLPAEFVNGIRSRKPLAADAESPVSDEAWVSWAIEQGAVPDFRGWELLNTSWLSQKETQQRLIDAIKQTAYGDLVLPEYDFVFGVAVNKESLECLIELTDGRYVCCRVSEFSRTLVPNVESMREVNSMLEWPRIPAGSDRQH
ncbi:MAG: hypothetical protein KDB90_04955 [Planctomycetes bacterium]|nr:hypothetical protein [Planctomycetota bacterium]